jgi:hypothetical protein
VRKMRDKEIFDGLNDFDATNEKVNSWVLMGDPYYGNIKGLDPRKGFLVENNFMNVFGLAEHSEGDGRDSFNITESGNIEVGGEPIERLNDEMTGKKATITQTADAAERLGEDGVRTLAESDHVHMINPEPVYSISNHKGDQHILFDQSPVEIPFFVHSSEYSRSTGLDEVDVGAESFLNDFERQLGYDGPIVRKKDDGGKGEDVSILDSPRELAGEWAEEGEIPNDEVIQMFLDIEYDERVIIGGDISGDGAVISSEKRYGDPNNPLCNISQVEVDSDTEDYLDVGSKIVKSLKHGYVDPVKADEIEDAKTEMIADVYDTIMSYVEDEWGWSDNYRQNFRGSIDVAVWDPEKQEHLSDEMVEELTEYVIQEGPEEGYVATPIEFNNQSGSMIDAANIQWLEQDTAANLAKQMYEISEGDELTERGLPYNMSSRDMVPEGDLGDQRKNNRYFGLFRKSPMDISADELYELSKSRYER